ncbi:hypothetical protein AVEN_211286-1 [Araneus ventricosus]|uniref:BTB domain-containing protein n=1 Tax=Araneus ventricosus TaxID=182803 RepID=A0A4Y2HNT4_ARAVE|nr:hypothetical protein AVEN_211286-1 [Araneus ventricosus]
MTLRHHNQNFYFRFSVSVYPNGVNKETEGWLVVLADVKIPENEPRPRDYGILSYLVSVIDIEGNSRFPRSFVEIPSEKDDRYLKYLERSLILNRKDEFLTKSKLTVRCDIHFYFDTVSEELAQGSLEDFLRPVPKESHYRGEPKLALMCDVFNQDLRDAFELFDFTHQILNFSPSLELRRRFGFNGFLNMSSCDSSDSEEDMTDILEHVWIFDTQTVRFLISLEEGQDGLGARLLKASPVIERMVNAPMKERLEKRIQFPGVTSRTFQIVLFFLEKGRLPASPNRDFLGVYEFSHSYEMEELQRKCAEKMVKSVEFSTEELKRAADDYSDEYLTELLALRRNVCENLEQQRFRIYEKLNSDCYI